MFNNIIDELKWREILKDISNIPKIIESQNNNSGIYCGFDPTSNSLHIGNLIQLLALKRFSNFGFIPFVIIGQATAIIGDPSGKKNERPLNSMENIKKNIANINQQIKHILPNAKILNNNDWLKDLTIIDFLYNIGKKFNISYLINKEHIKSRLETGISFTEFTYTLLQSYDFNYLYNNYNVTTQIGGSDQWGNIISGIEYIKSNNNNSKAAGATIKLLLKPDGNKFGKTESGTIWLDRNRTNPYDFYQFFFNQEDKICITLLKYFTFYSKAEILEFQKEHLKNPKNRYIQKKLASSLVELVHDKNDLNEINKVNNFLFQGDINNLDEYTIKNLLSKILIKYKISNSITNIVEVLIDSKICTSKREARELINNKAIMINGNNILDLNYNLILKDALYNKYFLIKKGKKTHFLIEY